MDSLGVPEQKVWSPQLLEPELIGLTHQARQFHEVPFLVEVLNGSFLISKNFYIIPQVSLLYLI
jgi:hypothetical protein